MNYDHLIALVILTFSMFKSLKVAVRIFFSVAIFIIYNSLPKSQNGYARRQNKPFWTLFKRLLRIGFSLSEGRKANCSKALNFSPDRTYELSLRERKGREGRC